MLNVLKKWYDQSFQDEEAAVLMVVLLLGAALLIFFGDILTPVIAALVFAFLLQGLVAQLLRLNVPHIVAVTTASALLVFIEAAGTFLLLTLLLDQLNNLVRELPTIIALLQEKLLNFRQHYPTLLTPEQIADWTEVLNGEIARIGQWAVSFSQSNISYLISFMIYMLLVPILVFFFLKDKNQILHWCGGLMPEKSPLLLKVWGEMNSQMANYTRGKVIEMFIVAGVAYIVFRLFGLNYAALLAIATGVSVIVPYVGAFLVTLPVALVAYLQWGLEPQALWVVFSYIVIQALDGNVLVPILFSEAVNLHPVAILLAILFFGSIWGLWGVFFAIPLATLIKAVIYAWPRTHSEVQAEQ